MSEIGLRAGPNKWNDLSSSPLTLHSGYLKFHLYIFKENQSIIQLSVHSIAT